MTANIETPQADHDDTYQTAPTYLIDHGYGALAALRDAVRIDVLQPFNDKTTHKIVNSWDFCQSMPWIYEAREKILQPPYNELCDLYSTAVLQLRELLQMRARRDELLTQLLHTANQIDAVVAYDYKRHEAVKLPTYHDHAEVTE